MDWIEIWKAIRWDPPGGAGWLFLLLAPLAVAYAAFVYRRTDAPLSPRFRGLLIGLRAAFLLILLAILCRPVLSLAVPGGAERGVLVLLDRSLSMTLPGREPGTTRDDELRRVRTALQGELGVAFPVTEIPFAAGPGGELDPASPLPPPAGDRTALAGSLESGVEGGHRPGAVVLVTDGTQTHGPDPVPVARRLGIPVNAVVLGAEGPVSDLALVRVRANPEAFLGERTPLEAVVRLQELPGDSVTVVLRDVTGDPVELARTSVEVPGTGAELRVPVTFVPRAQGRRYLEVRLASLPGEATAENNRRLVAVDVREEKTGVLFLTGDLTWDHTFLRRALEEDSTLAVTAAYVHQGQFRSVRPGASPPALDAGALREYRVIVLDHLSPAALGPAALEALAGFVRSGGGLVLNTGSGPQDLLAWRGTPVEPLLPVTVERASIGREAQTRLGPGARRHALFDPTVPGNLPLDVWTNLPPVATATGIGTLKGHAEALLVTADEPATPVLSWAPAGSGRVVLFAGGGLWTWDFLAAAHRTEGKVLPGWWRRLVQWMARPIVETRLDVQTAEAVVPRGEPVRFVARVLDSAYRPLPGAAVGVDVESGADGARTRLDLEGGEGFLEGSLPALPPGRYRFQARAAASGGNLGTVEGSFAVDSLGAEFERLEPDHELLARLTRATGGRLWFPDSLDSAAEELRLVARGEEEIRQVDLWDHPVVFALFVLVGSTEWFLRRRRGLI